LTWWANKVRQSLRHVVGRVADREIATLRQSLTPAQLRLFLGMHRADQRHGLDVVETLRRSGRAEPELILAALFHDAAKGPSVKLWHRVAWSLGERYGEAPLRLAARLPGFPAALERIRHHPERSAELALAAGCPPLTAQLIRLQAAPEHRPLVDALRFADEAN
jgi:hypothetical protein